VPGRCASLRLIPVPPAGGISTISPPTRSAWPSTLYKSSIVAGVLLLTPCSSSDNFHLIMHLSSQNVLAGVVGW
jgi:hypothetical protein